MTPKGALPDSTSEIQSANNDSKDTAPIPGAVNASDFAETAVAPPGPPSASAFDSDRGETRSEIPSPMKGHPALFGRYELVSEIARGGMGVVYKARQPGLDRLVALKMVLSGYDSNQASLERFLIEARAAASLDHPNVVQIFDSGEIDGKPYFTMALIDGPNLRSYVESHGNPTIAESMYLFFQIVAGVAHAHRNGIIHRDLKPANILLADSESSSRNAKGTPSTPSTARLAPTSLVAKVTDFGLAKRSASSSELTGTGQVMGTPAYMAPEQARDSKEVGPAADVYSLGAILYYLLTTQAPFAAESVPDLLIKVVSEPPVPPRSLNPSIPVELEALCLRCLAKSPADRYPDARALAEALVPFSEEYLLPLSASGATPYPIKRIPASSVSSGLSTAATVALPAPPPTHRVRVAALAFAAILLAGLAVYLLANRGKGANNSNGSDGTTQTAGAGSTTPETTSSTTPPTAGGVTPTATGVMEGDELSWPKPSRGDFNLKVSIDPARIHASANGVLLLRSWLIPPGEKTKGPKIHLRADKESRVVMWNIDPDGNVTQLLPNLDDPDIRLTPRRDRIVPGNSEYDVELRPTLGTGIERLWVTATTGELPQLPPGAKNGRYTTYTTKTERRELLTMIRGFSVKSNTEVSEVELLYRVDP